MKASSDVETLLKRIRLVYVVPYLDRAVVLAGRLTPHVAGVAAAGAALHLHARRPDDEVGRGGVHLAPGDLVDRRPHLAHRRHGLLYHWGGGKRPSYLWSSDKLLENIEGTIH